ncbi:MAG: elongation factor G [Phototrophicales bacterium]|nr:elongation factor G [Phototrophicales bacterium]
MREYLSEKLRNVALVGHQGCGKTSLIEALLFNTGKLTRMGRVEDGSTVSDWDEDEKSRGISLSTSLIPLEYDDHKVNVLDAPGSSEFQGEIKNAIRVADAVIVVVDAVSGVEVGTELAWDYAKTYLQPIIVVINKMDRENADFERTLDGLRATFTDHKFVPVMLPIGKEANFKGVINVQTKKAYYDVGRERADLPADYQDEVEEAYNFLVEAAAEADDDYIEKYFTTGELTTEEIRDGMRKAARNHELNTVPVFVTSGTKNIGTYPLMEALIVYTSAPTDRRVGIHREGNEELNYLTAPQKEDGPLAAYVFKTTTDKYVGTLTYFRIFSGMMTGGSVYHNSKSALDERFNQLLDVRGKETIPVDTLHVGDIGVVAKLTKTKTGDTICGKDRFTIVTPDFPEPIYAVALTPRTQADSAKMGVILTNLCDADPTLRWRQDVDTKQVILEGLGEIHVSLAISRAERLGVGMDTHMPRVPYRETVTKTASTTYRHRKQTGGSGQFGEVSLRVEPNPGGGFVYETKIVGGAISHSFLPSIEKGIVSVLDGGVIAGYPIVDVRAVAFDGKEHPVDSKDIAFQIAGREAFKEAFLDGGPVLLEPIMNVQIAVPEAMMGDIMGDLNTRRGRVQGMDTLGLKTVINAQVPLAEMLRYSNDLRSMSGGRGIYRLMFSHYEKVPSNIAEEVMKAHKAETSG